MLREGRCTVIQRAPHAGGDSAGRGDCAEGTALVRVKSQEEGHTVRRASRHIQQAVSKNRQRRPLLVPHDHVQGIDQGPERLPPVCRKHAVSRDCQRCQARCLPPKWCMQNLTDFVVLIRKTERQKVREHLRSREGGPRGRSVGGVLITACCADRLAPRVCCVSPAGPRIMLVLVLQVLLLLLLLGGAVWGR